MEESLESSARLTLERYNSIGEWKPLPSFKDFHLVNQEIMKISDDPEIQGILRYIRVTGFKCVEFAVKEKLKFPKGILALFDEIYLTCCNSDEKCSVEEYIYDGWIYLENNSVEGILEALRKIDLCLQVVAFAYRCQLTWCIKYRFVRQAHDGCTIVEENDLPFLEQYLSVMDIMNHDSILRSSIEWYNSARLVRSPLVSFLCYFVALESAAVSIHDKSYSSTSKKEKNDQIVDCIIKLHDEIYSSNPREFVSKAYFNCEKSLKKKLKSSLAEIFGENHNFIDLMFKAKGGYSLHQIRSSIAHGDFTEGDSKCIKVVNGRMLDIEKICYEFLNRLLLRISQSSGFQRSHHRAILAIDIGDPRCIFLSPSDIASKKWNIKPEWIE